MLGLTSRQVTAPARRGPGDHLENRRRRRGAGQDRAGALSRPVGDGRLLGGAAHPDAAQAAVRPHRPAARCASSAGDRQVSAGRLLDLVPPAFPPLSLRRRVVDTCVRPEREQTRTLISQRHRPTWTRRASPSGRAPFPQAAGAGSCRCVDGGRLRAGRDRRGDRGRPGPARTGRRRAGRTHRRRAAGLHPRSGGRPERSRTSSLARRRSSPRRRRSRPARPRDSRSLDVRAAPHHPADHGAASTDPDVPARHPASRRPRAAPRFAVTLPGRPRRVGRGQDPALRPWQGPGVERDGDGRRGPSPRRGRLKAGAGAGIWVTVADPGVPGSGRVSFRSAAGSPICAITWTGQDDAAEPPTDPPTDSPSDPPTGEPTESPSTEATTGDR